MTLRPVRVLEGVLGDEAVRLYVEERLSLVKVGRRFGCQPGCSTTVVTSARGAAAAEDGARALGASVWPGLRQLPFLLHHSQQYLSSWGILDRWN